MRELIYAGVGNDVACLIDFNAVNLPHDNFKLYHHNTIQGLATAEKS